jgi:hypothetical protein
MAAKLGSDDVSFRLGAGEVAAVYLGTQEVWSAVPPGPATLYFDGDVDDAWTTVGNWWLDAEHTQAAGRLPTSDESVVASVSITASGQTVVDFTLNDPNFNLFQLSGALTVTGMATFNGVSFNKGTITGNATFNGGVRNQGTITGNATFNEGTLNQSTITGNATFNDISYNQSTITGNATFNDNSGNAGVIGGNATFNDSSFNDNFGIVTGTATFTGSACNRPAILNENEEVEFPAGAAGTFDPDPPPACP